MTVESFDSFDDAMRSLRRDMDAADARVQPWQAAIKPRDYFTHATEYGFDIYGEVLCDDEPHEPEVRNYRLCRGYSIACPDGEFGDVHVSVIERLLTHAEFNAERQRGWMP